MKTFYKYLIVADYQKYRKTPDYRSWFLLFVLMIMQMGLFAQYTITRCSELSQRPKAHDPTTGITHDILAEGASPDGSDCYIYHHRNGKDYVVIPNSWGSNPITGKMELIEDAMAAITDTRITYADYGSLDNELYYMFIDGTATDYSSFAYWLMGDQCWISTEISPGSVGSRDTRKFVFAHEVGHCFIMENVDPPHLGATYDLNEWFDESISEFLASEVYITVNTEFSRSKSFDLDASPFTQLYNAWPLWYYFVLQRGKSAMVPEMNALARLTTREARLRHFRGTGFDRLYHDFLFEFYTRSLQDRGGGLIQMEDTIVRRQDKIQLIPEATTPMILDTIPSERLSIYQIVIPPSHDVTIYPPSTTNTIHFSLLNHPDKIKNWNEPVLIEGYCDREREFRLLVSHLNIDQQTEIPVRYELNERVSCCTLTTAISDNPPPDDLDGQFHFDYYIESEVEMMADGTTQTMPMNYFVNSRDGSMLLLRSFFMDNFGSFEDNGMKADAVIWLANGQIVAYVQDKTFGQKRAITLDMNQTRGDVMGPRAINPEELLREGRNSGVSPAALPSDSPWSGQATAYSYYREERFDPGVHNLMTSYVSNDNSVVASPMSSFGFMVGHIKDLSGQNKHLVYTRYETPGGDIMRAKLQKLEKECASFNGAGYKKMTLGGYTGAVGAMSESEREAFADSQMAYNEQTLAMMAELERCGDNQRCINEVTRRIMEQQKARENEVYDLPAPAEFSGDAGSDFQEEERLLRDRMYALQDQMMDKDLECDRLSRLSGASNYFVEQCRTQFEAMQRDLDRLECEMAKLHGAGDMLEDCH